jgi:hypothetical protein
MQFTSLPSPHLRKWRLVIYVSYSDTDKESKISWSKLSNFLFKERALSVVISIIFVDFYLKAISPLQA